MCDFGLVPFTMGPVSLCCRCPHPPPSWPCCCPLQFFCHLQQPQRRLLGLKLPSCHKQTPSFRVRVFASGAPVSSSPRRHIVEFCCASGVAPRLFRTAFDNIVSELVKVPGLLPQGGDRP